MCMYLCYIADPPNITGVPSETKFIKGKIEAITITIHISGTPPPKNITRWNESSMREADRDRFICSLERLIIGPLFKV